MPAWPACPRSHRARTKRARGFVMWAMPWPGWPGPDPRGTCLLALAPRRPSAELAPRALSLPNQPPPAPQAMPGLHPWCPFSAAALCVFLYPCLL